MPERSGECAFDVRGNGLTSSGMFNLRTKCAEMIDKQSGVFGLVGVALTSEVSSHYKKLLLRLQRASIEGGVKLDPWDGGKLDQMSVREIGIGREGGKPHKGAID